GFEIYLTLHKACSMTRLAELSGTYRHPCCTNRQTKPLAHCQKARHCYSFCSCCKESSETVKTEWILWDNITLLLKLINLLLTFSICHPFSPAVKLYAMQFIFFF
uniref:Uncharacterized protein n=1 Tax=Scleropages formosus TaxID=113540 RepID=A0A8C9QZP8_SCLFO